MRFGGKGGVYELGVEAASSSVVNVRWLRATGWKSSVQEGEEGQERTGSPGPGRLEIRKRGVGQVSRHAKSISS